MIVLLSWIIVFCVGVLLASLVFKQSPMQSIKIAWMYTWQFILTLIVLALVVNLAPVPDFINIIKLLPKLVQFSVYGMLAILIVSLYHRVRRTHACSR